MAAKKKQNMGFLWHFDELIIFLIVIKMLHNDWESLLNVIVPAVRVV